MHSRIDENAAVNYRWQCRRGMLELDILLNNFVDTAVNDLTPAQKQTFEHLLSYPDQTLLDLLLGNAISSDPLIVTIVQKIQQTPFD